jgi:hypothetical protein
MNRIATFTILVILAVLVPAIFAAGASAEFKSSSKQGKGELGFFDLDGGGGEVVCGETTEGGSPASWINNSGTLQVKVEHLGGCRAGKEGEEEATINNCQIEVKEPGEQMKMVEGTVVKSCNLKEGSNCEIGVEATKVSSELAFNGEENENLQVEPETLTGDTKTGGKCPIESSKQEKVDAVLQLDNVQPAPARPNFFMFRSDGPQRMRSTSEVRRMTVGNIGAAGTFNLLNAPVSQPGNWIEIKNKTVQECRGMGQYAMGAACVMEVKPLMIPRGNAPAVGVTFEVVSPGAGGAVSRAYIFLF